MATTRQAVDIPNPSGIPTIVVAGHYSWGKGATLAEAKKNFGRNGGKLSDGYIVLTFDGETEFLGFDVMGRYSWNGNRPTSETFKARTRKTNR